MCGIVGCAGRERIAPDRLVTMRDTMTHRGPDDLGLWTSADGAVSLAHRRLAVIDLSPGGHQPMSDSAQRIHIVFNGEIYNFQELRRTLESMGHRFRSASDTEVIVEAYKAYGEAFPERLTGAFAIALYDEDKRVLYLARDRAGEKPLFIWQRHSALVFASELKALLVHPDLSRRIDPVALEHYLAFNYVPRNLCMISGVRKLLPGHVLRFNVDSGETSVRRYWELPELESDAGGRSANELAGELEVLLRAAVQRQLVADVPVGILLSGGIDSSLITALAASVSPKPVRTFTIAFPGDARYDESPHARIVARHFGTEHVELAADDSGIDLLPQLVRQYDEPLGDSSAIPTFMVSRLVRTQATVALGGDGGDELFGGYPQYVWLNRIARLQSVMPSSLCRLIGRGGMALPTGTHGRNYVIALGSTGFTAAQRSSLSFDAEWRRRLLVSSDGAHPSPDELRMALTAGAHTMLQAMQRIDFRSYMVDDILVKVDRASMLASLEVRAPFLDPAVIEFAFGRVPDHFKTGLRERKILLRHLAARLLPPELDLRRKQGFSIPFQAWFDGQWGSMMREVLGSAGRDIFRPEAIRELFDRQERTGNQLHRLYALTVFELWRREYRVEL